MFSSIKCMIADASLIYVIRVKVIEVFHIQDLTFYFAKFTKYRLSPNNTGNAYDRYRRKAVFKHHSRNNVKTEIFMILLFKV